MTQQALVKATQQAVPAILKAIAPELSKSIPDVVNSITTISCKDEILMAKMIEQIGPEFVKYSTEIAQRLVEYAKITEASQCKQAEYVISAIMNDEVKSIDEKVELVLKYQKMQNDDKQKVLNKVLTVVTIFGLTFLTTPVIINFMNTNKSFKKLINDIGDIFRM